jgi:hypothetical protein
MIRTAVILVALVASVAGIRNGLVLDDAAIVLGDERLHHITRWGEIAVSPYWYGSFVPDLYRPLLSVWLSAQYLVGGGTPFVFHAVSYLLYCGAAVAFLRLASAFLPHGVAFAVGLLFAAHPVHVEAVAVAVAQNELLVAVLVVGAVLFYLARRNSAEGVRPRDWAILGGCYAAAALLKENGLILPGFLVIAEVLISGASTREKARQLWKGYAALALVMCVLLAIRWAVLQQRALAPSSSTLANTDVADRILIFFKLVPEWLRLLAWPQHLRVDYGPQEFAIPRSFGPRELLGLTILAAGSVLAWSCRRRYPVVTFALGWMALALLPVSNVLIPTGILLAERTLFLPSMGALLLAGALGAIALERWRSRHVRHALAAVVAVMVTLGIWRSATRHLVWKSSETLAHALVTDSPRSWWAHWFFAAEQFRQLRVPEGRAAFERSIQLSSEPWIVRNDYAKKLRQIGDELEAARQLERSLAELPRQQTATFQYVAALIGLGRYRDASEIAAHILQMPDAPRGMFMLRTVAERALATNAPPGSIRVGVPND